MGLDLTKLLADVKLTDTNTEHLRPVITTARMATLDHVFMQRTFLTSLDERIPLWLTGGTVVRTLIGASLAGVDADVLVRATDYGRAVIALEANGWTCVRRRGRDGSVEVYDAEQDAWTRTPLPASESTATSDPGTKSAASSTWTHTDRPIEGHPYKIDLIEFPAPPEPEGALWALRTFLLTYDIRCCSIAYSRTDGLVEGTSGALLDIGLRHVSVVVDRPTTADRVAKYRALFMEHR